MSSLGSLVIELAANTARLQSDMGKAVGIVERTASQFKTAFKFAGVGLLGAAFVNAAKEAIDFGDSINKASLKSGIGAQRMSELAYAAQLADIDVGSLSTAIKKMQVSLSEAGTGATAPTQALAALGLTIDQLQKRKPEAQFELIGDRISKLKDPADRARAATELFGKAGADLLPLFSQGAAGIAKARAEAEKLGLSFRDEQIKALADADDSIKRLDASWKGFATTLAARVAPWLSHVLDMFSGIDTRSVAKQLDDEIDAINKRLQGASFGVGGGVGGSNAAQQAELREKLLQAQNRRDLLRNPTKSADPNGRVYLGTPVGFAAAKAADEAQRAREKDLKHQMTWAEVNADINKKLDDQLNKDLDGRLEYNYDRYIKYYEDLDELRAEDAKRLAAYREAEKNKISENAQVFRDGFLNAWDDMVNTGKFKWDELLKYMLAEFARRGIVKLFDSIFAGGNGGGGGGLGGLLGGVLGGIKNVFGGGRATGGAVQAGKFYEVGERGRELFAPGMSGSIIPNGAGSGGPSIVVNNHIDARGATIDLVRALPGILKQNREVTIAEVVDGLKRQRWAL